MNIAQEFSSPGSRDEFRSLALRMAEYYQRAGCDTRAFDCESLPHFSALAASAQKLALSHLRSCWSVLERSEQAPATARNNAQAMWATLRVLGFTPPADLFSRLEADDLIEIYEPSGLQIWRNIGVMEVCSYTIEEMHSFDWSARYEREEEHTQAIFKIVTELIGGGPSAGERLCLSKHFVRERFSRKNFLLEVSHDDYLPLRGRGPELGALFVRSKGRVVAEGALDLSREIPTRPRLRLCADAGVLV